MNDYLPAWASNGLGTILPVLRILGIIAIAWLLQQLSRRLIRRLDRRNVPAELLATVRRVPGFLTYGTAVLLVLQQHGVSATVLWTAFTGFAAVGAVAFFAVWSVLSNIFCSLLIFTTRPFRLYERIEVLEDGEKKGLKGRVVDINLIYTTLQEESGDDGQLPTTLQVPNTMFFQRVVRRWRGAGV